MNDRVLRCRAYFPEDSWSTWVHLIGKDDRPICGTEEIQGARLEPRADIENEDRDICQKCLQTEAQYSVQRLRGGQVRRYGPSEWLYIVTDDAEPPRAPDIVLGDCMRLIHEALREQDSKHWHMAFVKEFKRVTTREYRYLVFAESTH